MSVARFRNDRDRVLRPRREDLAQNALSRDPDESRRQIQSTR